MGIAGSDTDAFDSSTHSVWVWVGRPKQTARRPAVSGVGFWALPTTKPDPGSETPDACIVLASDGACAFHQKKSSPMGNYGLRQAGLAWCPLGGGVRHGEGDGAYDAGGAQLCCRRPRSTSTTWALGFHSAPASEAPRVRKACASILVIEAGTASLFQACAKCGVRVCPPAQIEASPRQSCENVLSIVRL